MQKVCPNCQKDFKIRREDLIFYDQKKVPVPQLCPSCRMQRRLAFRNERTLYKRVCDLCHKDGVSIYPSGTPFPVYCHQCWWGDGWDPTNFGIDYDSSRPFLEQMGELEKTVPRVALLSLNSTNSDYTNNGGHNKNCYLIFAAEYNEDCLYGRLVQRSKVCMDCAFIYDSELCYECVDTRKSFKCMFSERLQECVDVLFSFDMRNCQNCILCTNGRNLSYCINNKQYTKEEFEKKKAEILSSYQSIEETKKKYEQLRAGAIVKYGFVTKCNMATGDYMHNCHEGVYIFDASDSKNCSYVYDIESIIDCQDCNNVYYKAERCYNVMSSLQSANSLCSEFIFSCNELMYSDSCHNCTSCMGCVGLNKKSYHILNKEYSKEDYEELQSKIITELKERSEWGEFLPPYLSPFGYNETLAKEYFPLNKDEALSKNFKWQEQTSGTYDKATIAANDIPATISEVTEDILREVLICKDCKKNFRITKGELDFYKRTNLPLPRKDFECRHQARMAKRNPRQLWPRSCMCELKNHQHGGLKCENTFQTSYSPEREEAVYCEACYQQEVS